jgi:hypothetical protein
VAQNECLPDDVVLHILYMLCQTDTKGCRLSRECKTRCSCRSAKFGQLVSAPTCWTAQHAFAARQRNQLIANACTADMPSSWLSCCCPGSCRHLHSSRLPLALRMTAAGSTRSPTIAAMLNVMCTTDAIMLMPAVNTLIGKPSRPKPLRCLGPAAACPAGRPAAAAGCAAPR